MVHSRLHAYWGCWNLRCPNSYVKREIKHFQPTEELGYSPEEIAAINALEIGQTWHSEYGNHFITRVPTAILHFSND